MLDSFDNHNCIIRSQVFPTTKNHFVVGKQVAWEWNMDVITNKVWYKNEQNKILSAWDSSAEFVGRNIEDV